MNNLTRWEDVNQLADVAKEKVHLTIDPQTTWLLSLAEAGSNRPMTLLIDDCDRVYKSQTTQRKAWLEKEKQSIFSQAIIKSSFHDCRGKKQHRFPYLFRDAVFVPVDGPSSNPDTMWFNLFQIRECKKWTANPSVTVLTMKNGTEWIVPRTYRYLREHIEEVIAEYLTFADVLRKTDYTAEPLYDAEANFDLGFLNQCYYRVLKKETVYDPNKIWLSLTERKSNGNRVPKWVIEERNKQKEGG